MRIQSAQLVDFRNIATAQIAFSPRLTALIGPNGQGKTNFLEALYCVSALRPLRSVQRGDLLRAAPGVARARVNLAVRSERTGLEHELTVDLRPNGRTLLKDGKRCDTRAFLGIFVAVAFTPDDLQLTKAGPEGRRRFLDRAILDKRPPYLDTALRYARALRARNKLLVEEAPDEVLSAYDDVLAAEGAAMAVARARYVAEIAPTVLKSFDAIARPSPALELAYRSTLEQEKLELMPIEIARNVFIERLRAKRRRDRARRTTSVGPHLDDLEITLDGAPAKLRASQGQHRALVLALKLAEITHLREALDEPPVLLLDDISSELDAERSRQLFDAIQELDGQVVLTTTDERQVPSGALLRLGPLEVYDVRDGVFSRRTS